MKTIKNGLIAAKSELKKLTYPSKHTFLSNLRVVLVCCLLMAILVTLLDLVFVNAFDALLSLI